MIRLFKLIACQAILGLLLLHTQAQVAVTVQVPPVAPGDSTILSVIVDQAAGVAGADLVITGPDFILPSSAETTAATADFLVASRAQPGRIQVALARAQGLLDPRASLLQIPLQIAKSAPVGTYPLTISPVRLYSAKPAVLTSTVLGSSLQVVTPPPDLDADGLPDSWEQLYFGSTQATAANDYDHDGTSNLQEFLAGTDPTSAASVFRIQASKAWDSSGQPVAAIQWLGHEGRTYQIEWSDDPLGTTMAWHQVYNPKIHQTDFLFAWTDDGSQTLSAPAAVAQRYYRILIPAATP